MRHLLTILYSELLVCVAITQLLLILLHLQASTDFRRRNSMASVKHYNRGERYSSNLVVDLLSMRNPVRIWRARLKLSLVLSRFRFL